MALPRFLANIVRAGDSPEIVTTRNFDAAASVLEAYAQKIETLEAVIGNLGGRLSKANAARSLLFHSSSLPVTGADANRGYGIFGTPGGVQIQIDDDEIQAMNGAAPATLALNARGGTTIIGLPGASSLLEIFNQTLFYGATSWNVGFATGPTTVSVSGVYSIYSSDTTLGNITFSLPNPTLVAATGRVYTFLKSDISTNTVTVDAGARTIDGAATVVLGGNTGRSRLVIVSDGTNWRILELYEEGTYPATLTGCATSPTTTVSYTRNGKDVKLRGATVSAVSNTNACTITGMPSHLWPTATQNNIPVGSVLDNTLDHIGLVTISTAGVMTLGIYTTSTNFTVAFTAGGTKGLSGFVLSYSQV